MLRKILIVDDMAANRRLLREILRADYEITEAENGREALAVLRREPKAFSAVILDIVMPVMDGYAFLSEMRSDPQLHNVPVIVSTGDQAEAAEQKALTLGANDFIQKPFKPAVIKRRLQNIIGFIETTVSMTEQRVAEEKRVETTRQLMSIFANINSGISAVTIDGDGVVHLAFANDRYYAMLGYTKAQFNAEIANAFDLVHPDDRRRTEATVAKLLKSRKRDSYEYRVICRNGDIRYIRCHASITSLAGVGDTVLLSVITDTTKLVLAEQEVTRTAEQLQAIMDNINGGVSATVIKDRTARFLFTNDQYYAQLGYTREQYAAEVSIAFSPVHPDDYERVIEETQRASDEHRSATVSYRIIRRDGSIRWLQSNISVISFPDINEPVQLAVANDVTAQREVELRLKRTADQMQAIMDNINGGVSAATYNDKKFGYIFANDTYYALFGYTREQFSKELSGLRALIHPDDLPGFYEAAQEAERTQKPSQVEFRATKRDGSMVWLRRSSSVCRFDDIDALVHVAVTTDITKEKEAENQIRLYIERYRNLTQSIPGGLAVYSVGPAGLRMNYFNDGFFRYSGYSWEEYQQMSEDNPLCLIFEEDVAGVYETITGLSAVGESAGCSYRCRMKDGGYRWFAFKGSLSTREGDSAIITAMQFDITEQKETEDKLRMSEERFRIASAIGGRGIASYDIQSGAYYHDDPALFLMGFGPVVENVPACFIESQHISPDCVEEYRGFFDRMRRGEKSCNVDVALRMPDGRYRWHHADATVIFDAAGQPSQAIIVSSDITDQREKEAIYKKWQQSLQQKSPDSYTLFRWNLSKDLPAESAEGSLILSDVDSGGVTLREWTDAYTDRHVYAQDREAFLGLLNADSLLAKYYRGGRTESIEYRELLPEGGIRWLRLTIEMVEYPNSLDVEAYSMYEDIDAEKRAELLARERADTDPLTGILNRAAFAQRMEALINENRTGQHALMMLDIDGFKQLNDTLGHAEGDQALIDIASSLRSILRQGDLLGRFGGDEFVICLKDVPYDAVIEKKARQICLLMQRIVSPEVQISASVGISIYPRDGSDFHTLYRSADTALYSVKGAGKNNFAFYDSETGGGRAMSESAEALLLAAPVSTESKRRMLIVDDNEINRQMLATIFESDFTIETANTGELALRRMRHFGRGLSVVLLDLVMPGMSGFEVLEEMHENLELRTVPVIVVSGTDERETSLRAIQCGASDFVTKPVDAGLIRMRVQAAISRSENERLRAQNSYLLLQSSEEAKYRTVLESTGTVVIEYDWINGVFTYDPMISQHIAGSYDNRKLWRILLSDMVASALDVKDMQDLVHSIANDRQREHASMEARLMTPAGERHWFRMSVFKRTDEYQLANRMILTFLDVNEEVLADERLRYQAERDELTGLYNRRTFLRKVEETVRAAPANAYFMSVGDVDGFKMVNDRFSHSEGDRLLKHIAETLQEDADKAQGLCGRLGNDVFATLMPNRAATIDNILRHPRELLAQYPLEMELTCSIGYYIIDDPFLSADVMLDRAAIAKLTVKGNYSAKVAIYGEDMRDKLLLEQNITDSMEAALNGGHFDIYLQPQFNHSTGQICGAEALVRWLHPERGVMFLPGEFIPLFEKNGFITRLDEYVWTRTAALFREWLDRGYGTVPVSVNVSRMDTRDPLLCEKLMGILKRYDIPINLFRLEITESLFEENSERLVAVIERLHKAGFLIEMDDFGSGYSSLNILKDVPVDILKLDMRFFSGDSNPERSATILNAVMRMARWLHIPVIAEGVETKEQADYLASIGCPVIQGYLYAPPMPIAEFEKLLAERRAVPDGKQPAHSPDVSALWALDIADSQFFYNYMDAALIYEYHGGKLEVLRANRRFFELLHFAVDASLPAGELMGMLGKDSALFLAATERALASGDEASVELRHTLPGSDSLTTFVCTLRPLPNDGEDAVILCLVKTRENEE